MKIMELDNQLSKCPPCFENFVKHQFTTNKRYFTDSDVHFIESMLTNEPYDASIQRGYISDGSGGFSGYRYILKFPTDDDYVSFILRWS